MNVNLYQKEITAKVNSLGYQLITLSTKREQGNEVISLVVDRVEAIDMNAIVDLSHALNAFFDTLDLGEASYTLDISSLGAEKPLKVDELSSYIGRYINVHLVNPIDGENIYEGVISEVNKDNFILEVRIKTRVKKIDILLSNIYKVRLAIKF